MDLRDHLQSIYDRHEQLTPELVVEEAREESHPLHSRFEWDDEVAGEKYRRHQAHELIQSVRIVYRNEKGHDEGIRAFHAVRSEKGYVYEPLDEIVKNDVMTEILRRDMEREWRALKKRYDQFEEFRTMVRADVEAA